MMRFISHSELYYILTNTIHYYIHNKGGPTAVIDLIIWLLNFERIFDFMRCRVKILVMISG